MKRILILGATGSIGTSACDVIRTHSQDFSVAGLVALNNREKVEALGREFSAPIFCGKDAAIQAVETVDADVVLVATVGLSGLIPTLMAIERGVDVALANKETLVAAGELVTQRARERGVRLIPVDSEHSAIYQCLQGARRQDVSRLILTASGGPFWRGPEDLSQVTVAQALNHPRWKMGSKVTIDSATMMNKGFEILEARWLFDIPTSQIDVVVHPESIVHSLVTFCDGSTLAQLSPPDMRVPIQFAFTGATRLSAQREILDLPKLSNLTFEAPNYQRFPALQLVKEAEEIGGTKTATLSAADEVAVTRFLNGEIRFTDITRLVAEVMRKAPILSCDSVENVLMADQNARKLAMEWRGC